MFRPQNLCHGKLQDKGGIARMIGITPVINLNLVQLRQRNTAIMMQLVQRSLKPFGFKMLTIDTDDGHRARQTMVQQR